MCLGSCSCRGEVLDALSFMKLLGFGWIVWIHCSRIVVFFALLHTRSVRMLFRFELSVDCRGSSCQCRNHASAGPIVCVSFYTSNMYDIMD